MAAEDKYRLSRWTHLYFRKDFCALFNSLKIDTVYLDKETGLEIKTFLRKGRTYQEINDLLEDDIVKELLEKAMIVKEATDDMDDLLGLREALLKATSLEMMYLLVTDHCNLRCRYCFEETPEYEDFVPVRMTRQTAHRAIDLFSRLQAKYGSPNKQKVIHLYGGEPLMNKDIVRYSVELIKDFIKQGRLPGNTQIALVTNAILLDNEIAEFLGRHSVSVGISVDGPSDLNNKYRIAKDPRVDVFKGVKRAYRLLSRHGVNIGLSITLTPDSIERYSEVIETIGIDFPAIGGLSWNILHYNPNIITGPEYFQDAAGCLIKAFKGLRQQGIYEERMMRKLQAFIEAKPIFSDCGVTGQQIVVAPDGLVGVCQDFVKPRKYFDGTVNDPDYDPCASGLFVGWKKRSPFFMEACFDCPAIAVCGGGCPACAELETGSRWNVDTRLCDHAKLTLEWLIWDTLDQMGLDNELEK